MAIGKWALGASGRESDVFVSYANGADPMPLQQGEQW